MKNEYILRLKKTSIILGMIAVGSLTGCGSKNNENNQEINSEQEFLLKDTIFEKAFVADADGQIVILRKKSHNFNNKVYFDIINGENISDDTASDDIRYFNEITVTGSIFEYLTDNDMKKLVNKEFTKEDEIELLCRIKEENDKKINQFKLEN